MWATTGSISSHGPILLLVVMMIQPSFAQNINATDSAKDPPTISKSTAVVILVLIAAFFFMGFISLYIRHCSDDGDNTSHGVNPSESMVFRGRQPKGLDPALMETFPILNYAAVKELKIGKHALECAVCLTEFEDDDSLRLLPHCDHVFHPDCIDAWLDDHTTCPVCRADLHAPLPQPHPEESTAANSEETPQAPCIQRAPTVRRNASFGAPRRLWGKIARSLSTGHVAVKQWENLERFRLRLPEEVRREVMSGKLERATSMVVLQRETSSRRSGLGEGSSRGGSRSLLRSDRGVLSFLTRALSFTSSKMARMNSSRQGSLRGSVRPHSTRLPV